MNTRNFIGLESDAVLVITDRLNDLLANHQVHYANLRGLHWDIVGDKFIELHEFYEELYNCEASTIDEIAERIVKLGGHPENRFSEYLKHASIKETHNVSDWKAGMNGVIISLKTLLEKYRSLFTTAGEAHDAGTVLLAMKHISDIETYLWKSTAYVK